MAKRRIAIVEWTDSAHHGAFQVSPQDPLLKPCKMVSVGHVVRQDKRSITLGMDRVDQDQYRICETIYKRQVDRVTIREV